MQSSGRRPPSREAEIESILSLGYHCGIQDRRGGRMSQESQSQGMSRLPRLDRIEQASLRLMLS